MSGSVRIASLVPSLSELLAALGLAPWMVARTGFCIHPA
ncbi:MAG: cobalamin-binding protein, partial [Hylemonella sp.]